MVLAASNEALRAALEAVEAKLRSQMPDLGSRAAGALAPLGGERRGLRGRGPRERDHLGRSTARKPDPHLR